MKALEKISEISNIISAGGIEAANKEAEVLVTHCLGIEQIDLYKSNPELTYKQILEIDAMAGRRCSREPLQYILGYSYFMGLKILLGSGVLIPRPETELMAEQVIKAVSDQRSAVRSKTPPIPPLVRGGEGGVNILDLCTGSGCLALALAMEFPDAYVFGADISEVALGYARRNAELNNINNVTFLHGYLFEPFAIEEDEHPPVSPSLAKRGEGRLFNQNLFDLIISNPPYIRTDDIMTLQPEIRDWEPIGALDGGGDGLNFYREIISQAGKFLKTNGILMLELGAGCSDETFNMMKDAGYKDIELRKDYAGIERTIQGRWTN